ncbi:MAG: hypothetical protein ACTSQE_09915 [Candidatus Heimdallarchaeaceae archaeon]
MSKKGYDKFDIKYSARYRFPLSNFNRNEDKSKRYKGKDVRLDPKYLTIIFVAQVVLMLILVLLLNILDSPF